MNESNIASGSDGREVIDSNDRPEPTPSSGAPDLRSLTTLEVGGPAGSLIEADTTQMVIDAVQRADDRGKPLLILGGGSNVVISDDGWPGPVLLIRTRGVQFSVPDPTTTGKPPVGAPLVEVTAAAGENWDDLVSRTLDKGLSGLEALSGIPGLVGATPIQNVGAYGHEVASTITDVRAWDRERSRVIVLSPSDCDFSYRHSRFKACPDRFVILEVTFTLSRDDLSAPIRYAELATALGVELGERASATSTREAVLRLRRSKGMVLDPNDPDTRSAGSFFTNPILTPEEAADLPPEAPRYFVDAGVKTSAAWLISASGFSKGHGTTRARLSRKHTLALTNHAHASTQEILTLAREIRQGVRERFGIELVPEPVLVNCSL